MRLEQKLVIRKALKYPAIALLSAILLMAEYTAPETVMLSITPTLSDLHATRLDGKRFDTRQLAGKYVLIDFWAVWCSTCIKSFPEVSRLHNDADLNNLEVISIAAYSGGGRELERSIEAYNIDVPVVTANRELLARFKVQSYPTYILLDEDGQIVKKYVGEVPNLYRTIKADIAAIEVHNSGD